MAAAGVDAVIDPATIVVDGRRTEGFAVRCDRCCLVGPARGTQLRAVGEAIENGWRQVPSERGPFEHWCPSCYGLPVASAGEVA